MAIKIREVSGVNILDIEGTVDINASEIVETVGWLVNTGKLSIIVNLENVDLVDYSGLSILAIAYKNVVNHKGALKFLNVPLSVIELFRIVRLESVFEVYADEESAIASFSQSDVEKMNLRRKFPRLDMHIHAEYRLVGRSKRPKTLSGEVLNISGAGIYIYTANTLPINSLVELAIHLPDAPAPLEANGIVTWLADKDLQRHSYPGMGISFIHLTPEKEAAIIGFIERNITHRAEPL